MTRTFASSGRPLCSGFDGENSGGKFGMLWIFHSNEVRCRLDRIDFKVEACEVSMCVCAICVQSKLVGTSPIVGIFKQWQTFKNGKKITKNKFSHSSTSRMDEQFEMNDRREWPYYCVQIEWVIVTISHCRRSQMSHYISFWWQYSLPFAVKYGKGMVAKSVSVCFDTLWSSLAWRWRIEADRVRLNADWNVSCRFILYVFQRYATTLYHPWLCINPTLTNT